MDEYEYGLLLVVFIALNGCNDDKSSPYSEKLLPGQRQELVNNLKREAGQYFCLDTEKFCNYTRTLYLAGEELSKKEKKDIYDEAEKRRLLPQWVYKHEDRCRMAYIVSFSTASLLFYALSPLSTYHTYACIGLIEVTSLLFLALYTYNSDRLEWIGDHMGRGDAPSRNSYSALIDVIGRWMVNRSIRK